MNTERLKILMDLYLFAASVHEDTFSEHVKDLLDEEITLIDHALAK